MAAVYIGKLCKLKLGKPFSLAVIYHIETEFFVKWAVFFFRLYHLHIIILEDLTRPINLVQIA